MREEREGERFCQTMLRGQMCQTRVSIVQANKIYAGSRLEEER